MDKNYLRKLYILKFYLVNNSFNYSEWLRRDINTLILAIEKEILDTKEIIAKNKVKQERNKQQTIFDYGCN